MSTPRNNAPILRSRSYWVDFHRAKAERKARANRASYNTPIDLQDIHPVYTFVPGRTMPYVSIPHPSARAAPLYLGAGPPHTPVHGLPSISKNAQAIAQRADLRLRARPDPDAALLARLARDREPPHQNAPTKAKATKPCACPAHRPAPKKTLVPTECVPGRAAVYDAIE
ncbi:hypothetical protein B0H11DRAFT_2254458 [Mycena galericulata]|nr:hypothetical protein B0H11DRAFT_1944316 [Mycena galericulata]KAJ7438645.1 hypothetical protein B0H11DRAFT_2254458 [Mycena galericulata]